MVKADEIEMFVQVFWSLPYISPLMGGGSDLQRLSGGESCVLGMVTGVMAKACNYPFLVWKNTVQQGLKISLDPRIVYRGLPMACLNLGGTNAVQFGGTGVFQRLLATTGSSQDTVTIGGSFLGGAASGLPCSIWELCMIQQQRFGGSILGTPARFVKEYGTSALTRGVTMTVGREAMFTMSMLGITYAPALQPSPSPSPSPSPAPAPSPSPSPRTLPLTRCSASRTPNPNPNPNPKPYP